MPSAPKGKNTDLTLTYRIGSFDADTGLAEFTGVGAALQCLIRNFSHTETGQTINGKALCDLEDRLDPVGKSGTIEFDAYVPKATGRTFKDKVNLPIELSITEVGAVETPAVKVGIITSARHQVQSDQFQIETVTVSLGVATA